MRKQIQFAGLLAAGLLGLATLGVSRASAQDPILTPILVNTAAPIVVGAATALKPKSNIAKYEGYVMNSNGAQVTVRAKDNDMAVQTFVLTGDAATKMQQYIEKGGFQYGDKITVYYNKQSWQAVKFKGKPSATGR
jgi:hypothetical protein